MDPRLKQRLIGAAVLVALAVIFLPMLVKGPAPDSGVSDLSLDLPDRPDNAGTVTRDLPLVAPRPRPDDGALGLGARPRDGSEPADGSLPTVDTADARHPDAAQLAGEEPFQEQGQVAGSSEPGEAAELAAEPASDPEPEPEQALPATTAGGDYAHLDDQGRYHARMDFDQSGNGGGSATLPIPMKQTYSGSDYGIHFPNHADTDMIWACLNGDPDRPFALGTAPNPSQASPSTSANNHQNVIRTWGQNELTFDDKQGNENIYLFATKDHTVEVTNDETITVGHDQAETIGHDQSLGVGNNRDKTVGADQSEIIGRNKTIAVGGNHSETIGGNMVQNVGIAKAENIAAAKSLAIGAAYQVTVGAAMNETVGGAKMEEVGAFKGEAVGGNKSETVGGTKTISVGKSLSINVGDSQSLQIAKNLDEKVGGDHHEQVSKEWAVNAKKIQFMAEDQIVLKTGKAEIVMKKNGDILIKGKKIQVKGSGDVIVKGSKIKQN